MKRSLRILFVAEDNAVIERAHAGLRQEFAVHVLEVNTADAFAQCLRFGGFDIVLCDNHVTGFASVEAYDMWKAAGTPVPFLLLTGSVGQEIAVTCITGVANGYLIKGGAALPAAVRQVMATQLVGTDR